MSSHLLRGAEQWIKLTAIPTSVPSITIHHIHRTAAGVRTTAVEKGVTRVARLQERKKQDAGLIEPLGYISQTRPVRRVYSVEQTPLALDTQIPLPGV